MSKLHPFPMAPPPQLRKTPDSIPSATELELCTATLKRSKKACDDGCAIEDFMRHMKEKEKGKARAEHESQGRRRPASRPAQAPAPVARPPQTAQQPQEEKEAQTRPQRQRRRLRQAPAIYHYLDVWDDQDTPRAPAGANPCSFAAPLAKWDPSTLGEGDLTTEDHGHGPLIESEKLMQLEWALSQLPSRF
ncbi:hypothetical protein C0993_009620 [Termitomyces sp. T159_Od127]|nr:hypothetical protein C0993_009620 [Termitomyces sp. T159_Od127]